MKSAKIFILFFIIIICFQIESCRLYKIQPCIYHNYYQEFNDTTIQESYDIVLKSEIKDTLQLIKDLLDLEGDKRIFCIPIIGRSLLSSSFYYGKKHYYTIDVQALYKINELFYNNYFLYPYPVLTNKDEKIFNTDEQISEAFRYYKRWYDKIEVVGLDEARKKEIYPLDSSNIKWFGSPY